MIAKRPVAPHDIVRRRSGDDVVDKEILCLLNHLLTLEVRLQLATVETRHDHARQRLDREARWLGRNLKYPVDDPSS